MKMLIRQLIIRVAPIRRCLFSKTTNLIHLECGVDEAGRGAVMGPMVIGAVLLTSTQIEFLRSKGVKDSKLLSPTQRASLAPIIRANSVAHRVLSIEASEIDNRRLVGKENLNVIEFTRMVEILRSLNSSVANLGRNHIPQPYNDLITVGGGDGTVECIYQINRVMIDSFDANSERLTRRFTEALPQMAVQCETKADVNYISVAAASILAKVARDSAIEQLRSTINVPIGSGYPSDTTTAAFIRGVISRRQLGEPPLGYVRYSWNMSPQKTIPNNIISSCSTTTKPTENVTSSTKDIADKHVIGVTDTIAIDKSISIKRTKTKSATPLDHIATMTSSALNTASVKCISSDLDNIVVIAAPLDHSSDVIPDNTLTTQSVEPVMPLKSKSVRNLNVNSVSTTKPGAHMKPTSPISVSTEAACVFDHDESMTRVQTSQLAQPSSELTDIPTLNTPIAVPRTQLTQSGKKTKTVSKLKTGDGTSVAKLAPLRSSLDRSRLALPSLRALPVWSQETPADVQNKDLCVNNADSFVTVRVATGNKGRVRMPQPEPAEQLVVPSDLQLHFNQIVME